MSEARTLANSPHWIVLCHLESTLATNCARNPTQVSLPGSDSWNTAPLDPVVRQICNESVPISLDRPEEWPALATKTGKSYDLYVRAWLTDTSFREMFVANVTAEGVVNHTSKYPDEFKPDSVSQF